MNNIMDVAFVVLISMTAAITAAEKLKLVSSIPRLIVPSNGNYNRNKPPQLLLTSIINFAAVIYTTGTICTEGIQLALDALKNASLLQNYDLVVEPLDDLCLPQLGIPLAVNVLNNDGKYRAPNRLPLIAGPFCVHQLNVASLLTHFNFAGVAGFSPYLKIFKERQLYDSFFSAEPSFEIFYKALPRLLQNIGWTKVHLFSETVSFFVQIEEGLAELLEDFNITLVGTTRLLSLSGLMPAPEHIEQAVRELQASDPRIVILDTNFGSLVACWLHRYKLYGPNYIYVSSPGGFFKSNTVIRYPWCTDRMLSDVLQSMFFTNLGAPELPAHKDSPDSLGITPIIFAETLKSRIDKPEQAASWFMWRHFCYEQVAASALILHSVEETLQSNGNDTLLNWVTSGEKFRENGTYIHNLMLAKAEEIRYKGIGWPNDKKLNSRSGIVAFYQMQILQTNVSLSEAVQPVLVAWYDTSKSQETQLQTVARYVWRTENGQPPYDYLRIVPVEDPILEPSVGYALKAVAAFTIVADITLVAITVYKRKHRIVAKSLPQLNGLVLIGNLFMSCYIIVLPASKVGYYSLPVGCMSASFLFLIGFTLFTSSILTKLHLGYVILQKMQEISLLRSNFVLMHVIVANDNSDNNSSRAGSTSRPPSTPSGQMAMLWDAKRQARGFFERRAKFAPLFILGWTVTQAVIMAAWFGVAPLDVTEADRHFEKSANDLSVAYQHFKSACSLGPTNTPSVFLGILAACYLAVFLRSLILTIVIRSMKSPEDINDLKMIGYCWYSTGGLSLAGAIVVWLFFSDDPGSIEMASSILSLIVVWSNTLLIFAPKIPFII